MSRAGPAPAGPPLSNAPIEPVREAAEVGAAENIRAFYAGEAAPLPDAAPPPTPDELAAADDARW